MHAYFIGTPGPFELLILLACFGFFCALVAVPIVVILVVNARNRARGPALCPDCGQPVSPEATGCPNCGRPLRT